MVAAREVQVFACPHRQLWSELQPCFSLLRWSINPMLNHLPAANATEALPVYMLSRSFELKFLTAHFKLQHLALLQCLSLAWAMSCVVLEV